MPAEPKPEKLREAPYWWDAVEPLETTGNVPTSKVDVVVIGGGYTGLSAALTLAKSGRSVVVVEAEMPGFGASSRNGGMISNMLKPGLSGLIRSFGKDRGVAIYREAVSSVKFIEDLVGEETLACDFNLNGRFYPAVLEKHLTSMTQEWELREKFLGRELGEEMVDKQGCAEDIASDLYVGGLRQHPTGGLHPAKFVNGLAASVQKQGGKILAPCRAVKIARKRAGFDVETTLGALRCEDLLIATNGYSSDVTPYLQKRVIPIGSTMIATQPLPKERVKELFPQMRMITDSRNMLNYYRPSPDGTRVLLGGRPSVFKAPPSAQAQALQVRLREIFPVLKSVAVSHVWSGNVAYSFAALPSIGRHDGVYYAMAYCGSGVAMSSYLGHKTALKILGGQDGQTAFDDLAFEDRSYYNGKPWFLPLAMIGYRMRDYFGF